MKQLLYATIIIGISFVGIAFAQPASCGSAYQLSYRCDYGIGVNGECGRNGGYCAGRSSGGTSDSRELPPVCIRYNQVNAYINECPPPSTINSNGNGEQNNDIAPSCPRGSSYSVAEQGCKPDCGETLTPPTITPNPLQGWTAHLAPFMPRPTNQPATQPQQTRPATAGPSIGGFAGILPSGRTCEWVYKDPKAKDWFACVNASQAGTLVGQQKECAFKLGFKEPADTSEKFECKNTASVFDALWGFLTHRKPY